MWIINIGVQNTTLVKINQKFWDKIIPVNRFIDVTIIPFMGSVYLTQPDSLMQQTSLNSK
jgi:hypothetical protein